MSDAMHLCLDLNPRTACGLLVQSQAAPRWDWKVPESLWTGPLGADLVTCLDCLAAAAFGQAAAPAAADEPGTGAAP